MRKNWSHYLRQCVLAAVVSAGMAGTVFAEENTFVQGTTVNGLGVSGMTVEEAKGHIAQFYSGEYQLKVLGRGGVHEVIRGDEIGFAIGIPDSSLQEILQQENAGGRQYGPDVDTRFRVEMTNTYDDGALTARIESLGCVRGENAVPTADAHISAYQEGEPYTIVPEVRGNTVDAEKVAQVVRQAVAAGDREVDLEEKGCYVAPQVLADDPGLVALCDTMNRCREMTVTYQFGEETEELTPDVICSWITGYGEGRILLDEAKVNAYALDLAGRRSTAGRARVFTTVHGTQVELTGPYGWQIDPAGEAAALMALVQTGESQTREPVYAARAASRTAPDWGSVYVEVDLTGQYVFLVQDGQVVWDAPCVTGSVARGTITPPGIFSLKYKERNRVLRGAKRADGSYEYESPVSYWMPFNGGIGLHDANWRGNFGGTIYQRSGSHGCVNLPPSKVPALYDMVYPGIPVICY